MALLPSKANGLADWLVAADRLRRRMWSSQGRTVGWRCLPARSVKFGSKVPVSEGYWNRPEETTATFAPFDG